MKRDRSLAKKIQLMPTIFLILSGLTLSLNSHARQQNVLLDANGLPISDEILMMLSTNPGEVNKSKTATNIQQSNSKNAKPKKLKRSSNPLLEEELLSALKAGQTQRVKQLLKAGTSPTYKNFQGETPLGIAVTRGWASMVIELIENGANVREKGAKGVTLLHAASAKGLIDVAKVLVKYGLNPGQRTDKNWTPLHVAARYDHWQLVQYYVSLGVDPNIRNSDGKTALGLAQHLRLHGIVKILSPVTTRSSLDFKSSKKKRKKRRKSKRK